jgi:hypothetical protein
MDAVAVQADDPETSLDPLPDIEGLTRSLLDLLSQPSTQPVSIDAGPAGEPLELGELQPRPWVESASSMVAGTCYATACKNPMMLCLIAHHQRALDFAHG